VCLYTLLRLDLHRLRAMSSRAFNPGNAESRQMYANPADVSYADTVPQQFSTTYIPPSPAPASISTYGNRLAQQPVTRGYEPTALPSPSRNAVGVGMLRQVSGGEARSPQFESSGYSPYPPDGLPSDADMYAGYQRPGRLAAVPESGYYAHERVERDRAQFNIEAAYAEEMRAHAGPSPAYDSIDVAMHRASISSTSGHAPPPHRLSQIQKNSLPGNNLAVMPSADKSREARNSKANARLIFQMDTSKLSIMGADGTLKEAVLDSRAGVISQGLVEAPGHEGTSGRSDVETATKPSLAYSKKPRQVSYKPYTVADYNDQKSRDSSMLVSINQAERGGVSIATAAANFTTSLRSAAPAARRLPPRAKSGDATHGRRRSVGAAPEQTPSRVSTAITGSSGGREWSPLFSPPHVNEHVNRGRGVSMYAAMDALDSLASDSGSVDHRYIPSPAFRSHPGTAPPGLQHNGMPAPSMERYSAASMRSGDMTPTGYYGPPSARYPPPSPLRGGEDYSRGIPAPPAYPSDSVSVDGSGYYPSDDSQYGYGRPAQVTPASYGPSYAAMARRSPERRSVLARTNDRVPQ
jgi:hypothetical protein